MSKFKFRLFKLLLPAYAEKYLKLLNENYQLKYVIPLLDIEVGRKSKQLLHEMSLDFYNETPPSTEIAGLEEWSK